MIHLAVILFSRLRARGHANVGCIKIILPSNPDQREQRVAASIGQRSAHPVRIGDLRKRAYRPIGCDPFPRRMGEQCRQIQHSGGLIDCRGLNDGDLMLAEGFADDIEATR